jgi:mannose-6-phosphate isomerase-like protein (cupin superfamily)
MQSPSKHFSHPEATLPADDPKRNVTIARPEQDNSLKHIALAGDTYTILLTGADTAGRYCLIDMLVPPDGGPAPHRHDFEEMFSVQEGEIEITFRGEKLTLRAGETINVPANAPHFFKNVANGPARMLCLCSPAGQEEFFASIGDPVDSRTSAAPQLSGDELAERIAKIRKLAPQFKTELLDG